MNIAHYLVERAEERPYQRAIVFPHGRDAKGRVAYTQLTFRQLNEESARVARGLERYGIGRGCRTVLLVRPSLEFFTLTFALFRAGAVPVLIDPGMGRRRLLECVRGVEPQAFIGVPRAQLARLLFPKYFRSVKRVVTVGRRRLGGGKTLDEIRALGEARATEGAFSNPPHEAREEAITHGGLENPPSVPHCGMEAVAPTAADEMAAILFTTGSTGPAKGVVYTHGIFDAQTRWIQSFYGIAPGEIDLPGFPLFALFSVAMGMTCVIPDMDPSRPARVDPRKFVGAIHNQGCTNSFGSPAIWNRVSRYCVERGIVLPSLRRVLMAGAPVSGELLERMRRIMPPGGECHTPYGATESLPLSSISGSEVLGETDALSRRGAGTCVGRPLPGVTVRIIGFTDEAIEEYDESLALPPGQIGEIAAKSAAVTREYYNRPEATRLAKMRDCGGGERAGVWHRMGDAGYLDAQGRLWFCGRKSHRVVGRGADGAAKTFFSVCCEAIFNQHPAVFRSALVGVGPRGAQRPVIVIEPRQDHWPARPADRERFARELLELGAASELTREIGDVLFHRSFPVDIRHNAKIFRERIAVWAAKRVG